MSAPRSVLIEAAGLVDSDRSAAYGPPEEHHKQTGRVWAAILSRHYGVDLADLPPRVVDMMFVGDKAIRESHQHKRDNLVDVCGYARCAEIAEEGRSA